MHLIHPLGFSLDEKSARRAGLDYHHLANIKQYESFEEFKLTLNPKRIFAVSTKGKTKYSDIKYTKDDVLLFGAETHGLPDSIMYGDFIKNLITIPMKKNNRSLNLSNSVAIVLYEAWRQNNFV